MKNIKFSLIFLALSSVLTASAFAADPMPPKAVVAPAQVGVAIDKSQIAVASPMPTPPSDKAAGDLEKINKLNMEVMVLEAQLKKYESEGKIAAKRSEISKFSVSTTKVNDDDLAVAAYGTPTYKSIEGIKDDLYAIVSFPDGSEVEVKQGDMLPNGMKVMSVSQGRVEVLKGKKRMRLSKASNGVVPQAQAQNQISNPMVGLGSTGAFIPPSN